MKQRHRKSVDNSKKRVLSKANKDIKAKKKGRDEFTRLAIEAVATCSSCEGSLRLSNSLTYAELDIEACLPILNTLYNANNTFDDVKYAITIKDFLSLWDPDIVLHVTSDIIKEGIPTQKVERVQVETNNQKDLTETSTESDTGSKLNPLQRIIVFLLYCYLCVLFLNKCTSFNNEYTQKTEEMLYSGLTILDIINTIFDPSGWLMSVPQWFIDYITWINIVSIVILGISSIAVSYYLLFEEECRKYDFQPFFAFVIVAALIHDGFYGPFGFNLYWTALVPLTYLILIGLGVIIVKFGYKLFRPKMVLFEHIIKIVPLILWLAVYQIFHHVIKSMQ